MPHWMLRNWTGWHAAPRSVWDELGGTSGDSSGDVFVSFSTANLGAALPPRRFDRRDSSPPPNAHIAIMANWAMGPVFDATIQATEEAIVNALVGAKTITGNSGRLQAALPHGALRRLMQGKYAPTAW